MKKITLMIAGAALLLSGCGGMGTMGDTSSQATSTTSSTGSVLGGILGAVTDGETIGNVLSSVIGLDKLTSKQLLGIWRYDGPGCAFTSQSALAKAGGEVAATEVEKKLEVQYKKLGFTRSNTYIQFESDGTFAAKLDGKSWSGTYTFDTATSQLRLQGLLLNLTGYAKRNGSGISILFESKKLLTHIQTLSAMNGNTTIASIGEISKNYDGVRLGFDMKQ